MRDGKAQGRLARDLPGGVSPAAFTLEELRAAKQTYGFLTEVIPGPEGIGYFSRGFRYLLFFGIACIAEDKCPPLTRCWKDLATLFMGDPAFDDDLLVQSWILMDFPFGPARHTALDYFDELLTGTDAGPQLQRFIDAARRSRLGLHQDVIRTKKLAKSASFHGNEISAFPSIDEYGKGEILLARTMAYGDEVFIFGNTKGFPKEAKKQIEDMVLDKLFDFDEGDSDDRPVRSVHEARGTLLDVLRDQERRRAGPRPGSLPNIPRAVPVAVSTKDATPGRRVAKARVGYEELLTRLKSPELVLLYRSIGREHRA